MKDANMKLFKKTKDTEKDPANRPKRTFLYLFIAIILASFSCYAAPDTTFAENILENPGFEEKGTDGLPKGWSVVPHHVEKGSATQDDQNAHEGAYSLKLSPNKKNDKEGFAVFRMLNIEDIGGQKVTIRGFVKVEGIGKNNAAIALKTDKANWLKLPSDTGGKFVSLSKTISIAKSIPEAAILVFVTGTGGSVWLDDLEILVGREPSASEKKKIQITAQGNAKQEIRSIKLGDLPATAAILFVSNRDTGTQRLEIYAMDADGSNVTRLTFTNENHFITGIDRSRRYIVTSRVVAGTKDRKSLWVLDLKNKTEVRLTDPSYHAEGDSFSPDSQWIVFFMKLGDKAQMDIYKIQRDGSQLTRLTNTPKALEGDPAWSNDGKRIVFSYMNTQNPNPRFILKAMDVNGGDVKTVYDGGPGVAIKGVWPPGNYDANWSPDDRWIVFERAVEDTGGNAGGGIWHIFKVKADGSRVVDLSLAGGHTDRAEYLPSFSSNGKHIVFGSIYEAAKRKESHIDIFMMDSDGGSLRRLTHHPANDMYPAWITLGK